jgi:multiple RNA-binding domain-containing protein 1
MQISDTTLPVSRKAQREQERENQATRKKEREAASMLELNAATKRKRDNVDEADPKLKEFLEVMQPASKTQKWADQSAEDGTEEPPPKIQAIEVPGAESDDDYESVPKKKRKSSPQKPATPVVLTAVEVVSAENVPMDEPMPDVVVGATDDDWLRSRTNRLLDLLDPADIPAVQTGNVESVAAPAVSESIEQPSPFEDEPLQETEDVPVEEDEDKPDPILEEISKNGRLFVRNLPYTATEDDLRKHFEPFGSLEEVCEIQISFFSPLLSFPAT